MALYDLAKAQSDLQAQVASGGINEAQMFNELERLKQANASQGLVAPAGTATPGVTQVGTEGFNPAAGGSLYNVGGNTPGNYNQPLFNSIQNIGGDPRIKDAFEVGMGFSGLGSPTVAPEAGFFNFGSLGRVDTQRSPEVQGAIDRLGQTSNPLTQQIGSLSDYLASTFRERSKVNPDESTALERRREDIAAASQVDPNLQKALDMRASRLGGLSSPELQGLRELGERGIDRRANQLFSQARLGNIAAGRRGGVEAAGFGNIAREIGSAQADLEKRLIETNLDEKDRQLSSFTNLAGDVSRDKFFREQAVRGGFEGLLSTILGRTFSQGTGASQVLAGINQGQQNINQQGGRDFTNALRGFNQDQFRREQFNFDRLAAEKQGQLGLLFGLPSFIAQQIASENALGLGSRELELLSEQAAADRELLRKQIALAEDRFNFDKEQAGNNDDDGGNPRSDWLTSQQPDVTYDPSRSANPFRLPYQSFFPR